MSQPPVSINEPDEGRLPGFRGPSGFLGHAQIETFEEYLPRLIDGEGILPPAPIGFFDGVQIIWAGKSGRRHDGFGIFQRAGAGSHFSL